MEDNEEGKLERYTKAIIWCIENPDAVEKMRPMLRAFVKDVIRMAKEKEAI